MLQLLQENIRFCTISTRMEDALAVSPIIPEAELASLNDAFVDWYRTASVDSTSTRRQGDTPGMIVTKNVMRWRYLSSHIILRRPVLLWYAMRRTPYESLPIEKKAAIMSCRQVTAELINDIAANWKGQKPCQMSGWNATWLLYQAVMVPLLSLFSDPQDSSVVENSRRQVKLTLSTLNDLQGWSATAHRSSEVVSRIYETSKRLYNDQGGAQSMPYLSTTDNGLLGNTFLAQRPYFMDLNMDNEELFMDNMFDSLNWSTGWDNLDYPFETPSTGFVPDTLTSWDVPQELDEYFVTIPDNQQDFGQHDLEPRENL
jgi:hypothetical protein